MMYWQHPEQGTGSHSYYHPTYGTLEANFEATTYNWAGMSATSYAGDCPLLQFHVGVAFDMNYSPDGSGAYSSDIVNVLLTYFNYKNTLSWVYKSNYSTTGWQDLLIAELEAGRPMTYRGNNSEGSGGHAFVMDGCQGSTYFHFNWGWSGSNNGYFTLDNLNPGYDFSYDQAGCIGIEPEEVAPPLNVPLNTQAVVVENDVTITWDAPESKAVLTGYKVKRNGINISGTLSASTLTYLDEDLSNSMYTYCVKAVYDEGGSDCSENAVVTVNYVGIIEISNTVKIYPNPTTGELNINFGQTQAYLLEITDITGKIVLSDTGNNSILNYNISFLSKGIYVLNIKFDNNIIKEKIIIK